jgi:hypothetical protein
MAQVRTPAELQAWIEDYLNYLIAEWEDIPALAAEWDEWDDSSRLTFVVNWGVPADRLHQLQGWAEQGLLRPEQRARYERLQELVAQHQPTLERLLAD